MRLAVADDSLLFREGLVRLLSEQGFEIVGQWDNAPALVAGVHEQKPDVAIIDMRMPPTNTDEGLQAAERIAQQDPGIGIVVLSQYVESSYAVRLLEGGGAGRGYLLKDRVSDLESFAAAIRRVGEGGSVVDPEVVSALVGHNRQRSALTGLSSRENEILGLMAEGRSNAGICDRLVLSPRTVESHVRTIFRKLNLEDAPDDHRRVLAVLTYLRG